MPPEERLNFVAFRDKYALAGHPEGCVNFLPHRHDIAICLVGSEKHKARPDHRDPSGSWLRVEAEDVSPFAAAFSEAPEVYHEFLIEQRVSKRTHSSTLIAQIVKMEEGSTETRLLLRPHPAYAAAFGAMTGR